jgi:hypothetical protein
MKRKYKNRLSERERCQEEADIKLDEFRKQFCLPQDSQDPIATQEKFDRVFQDPSASTLEAGRDFIEFIINENNNK